MQNYTFVDLTHTLSESSPSWSGGCGFKQEVKLDYADCSTDVKFRVQQIKMHAGIGTHIDAPAHCIPMGKCVTDLNLNDLIVPCVVLDVSKHVHERYSLTVADIETFEEKYGSISPGRFVIVYTGWDRFWNSADHYRNNHVFPSVSIDAAKLLLARGIVGLGIDTLSPDRPEDGFLVHQLILGAGKYIIENIANAAHLPPIGAYSVALPIKTKDATEAPMRLIGLI